MRSSNNSMQNSAQNTLPPVRKKHSVWGNILTIMKKEFSRFFRDKRMVITMILPGVLIYLVYSFLGAGLFSADDKPQVYNIYVSNNAECTVENPTTPEEQFAAIFSNIFAQTPASGENATGNADENAVPAVTFNITYFAASELDNVKKAVEKKDADLAVFFPDGFIEGYFAEQAKSLSGDQQADKNEKTGTQVSNDGSKEGEEDVPSYPTYILYYNSVREESAMAATLFKEIFSAVYQKPQTLWFDSANEDVATEKDLTGQFLSSIAPMLVLTFLFSGCMAVAPESIAGEKERGTFSTMLVTPVKRSHIAIGKILSLSVLSVLSGLCSFLGLMLSFPKLFKGVGISTSVYGATEYIELLAVIISSVLVIVALIALISAYAKSVKEASGMVAPIMILVMLVGVSSMFSSGVGGLGWYLIPLYNSARVLSCVFSFIATPASVIVTAIANFLTAAILGLILTKMFDSEKIMFGA